MKKVIVIAMPTLKEERKMNEGRVKNRKKDRIDFGWCNVNLALFEFNFSTL